MKHPALRCTLLSSLLIWWVGVFASNPTLAQVPTITSFAPTSGPIGTTVTIKGSGFTPAASSDVVFFGAVRGIVTAATSTQLTVTVPVGATFQPVTVTDIARGLTAYSNKPFIVTFAGRHAIDTTSFLAPARLVTGSGPEHVAIVDLDGDGKPDMVVTDGSTDSISVFRNTSSNNTMSFAPRVDFSAGSSPNWIAISDFDGDGKPDVAVTNSNSNTISVFRNTSTRGSISFASKVDYVTGNFPIGIGANDLDGDGRPDIALVTLYGNTISIFRNTSTAGSISFAPKVDISISNAPCIIAIGDLDGDGKPDMAVAVVFDSTVSVFRNTSNNGSISFASRIDLATGGVPVHVAVADLDGDGKPDLITGNLPNNLRLFQNKSTIGDISFVAITDPPIDSNTDIHKLEIGDLNGDGEPDVVVTNFNGNTFMVFGNSSVSGVISFAPKVDFTINGTPWGMAVGDLDGDGRPEMVAPNNSSNTLLVFRAISAATGVASERSGVPRKYALDQNYPNPFNPSTTIRYALPRPAYATLKVFDLIGREVETLVGERKEAGYYQVKWNAQLPSGVYFYRLQAGEFFETKKMLLIR